MSQNELHTGKLVQFKEEQGESDIDTLKRVLKKFNKEFNQKNFEDYCDKDIACFLSEIDLYEDVFYVGGKFYINEEHKEYDDSYIDHLEKNQDGSYSYVMSFYNGGTCLSEMIEEALNEIKD